MCEAVRPVDFLNLRNPRGNELGTESAMVQLHMFKTNHKHKISTQYKQEISNALRDKLL